MTFEGQEEFGEGKEPEKVEGQPVAAAAVEVRAVTLESAGWIQGMKESGRVGKQAEAAECAVKRLGQISVLEHWLEGIGVGVHFQRRRSICHRVDGFDREEVGVSENRKRISIYPDCVQYGLF